MDADTAFFVERIESDQQIEQKILAALAADSKLLGDCLLPLYFNNERAGVACATWGNDPARARQHFYVCGRIAVMRVEQFNDPLLHYGLREFCYALFSDCEALINRLATLPLRTDEHTRKVVTAAERGGPGIYSLALLAIMRGDWQAMHRHLEVIERRTPVSRANRRMVLDTAVFRAFGARDAQAARAAIESLVTPKCHARRNDDPLLGKFISLPAAGYAKLANRLGIHVEFEHPLIPSTLMPISPLPRYEDPYPFLTRM